MTRRRLILHCLEGLGVGGAERQLALLVRYMPDDLFEHAVCHLGPRRDLAPEFEAMGVRVIDLCPGGRRTVPRALATLDRLVRAERPWLLHGDHANGKLCARLVGRFRRVPVLATVGNPPAGRVPWVPPGLSLRRLKRWGLRWLHRLVARTMTDHFLAITAAVRDAMVDAGFPADRITVVYRGVELDRLVPDPPEALEALRTALRLDPAGPVLLNVGRLVRQKGQDDLIRALPAIRNRHPGVQVLFAGAGPNLAAYRRLVEQEGVAGHVQFLGLRRDVRLLMQLADVFVFPSRFEGTGVALLEAMALERACVASRVPALVEVCGDDGAALLVPPRRPDLLAEGVLAVLADPDRRRAMGRRARERVRERFDIRRNALDFARLCRAVGEARRRTARVRPASRAGAGGPDTW